MIKLKSFGCSFIYGSELTDTDRGPMRYGPLGPMSHASDLTWPALIAKKLNVDYECHAVPGQGNFKIYCDILANSSLNDNSIYVINWTWIDRYDYVDSQEQWNTLRPSQENQLQEFYYKNLHSQLQDMISNASWVVSAIEHLKSLNCNFVMTYMDYNLLMPIDPDWHDPKYLEVLQQKLKHHLVNFDGLNFLDWARQNHYPIGSQWHPLEAAHKAAADYWFPYIQGRV